MPILGIQAKHIVAFYTKETGDYGENMTMKIGIDGSNLCAVDSAPKATFRLERLVVAMKDVKTAVPSGEIRVFVDANLRWKLSLNEKSELETLIRSGQVEQVPAGITADDYILEWANRNSAVVISNDQFKGYHSTYPWIAQRGSGRSMTAVFDQSAKTWTFLERNSGSSPARTLAAIAAGFVATAPVVVAHAPTNNDGSYSKRVSRECPTAFVLLLDQSGSMSEIWQNGLSKAEQVATIVNSALKNLVLSATRGGEVYDYVDIAVIGYGGAGIDGVRSMLPSTSLSAPFLRLSEIAKQPRVSVVQNPDGSSRRETTWFDPVAGGGTPMNAAFDVAVKAVNDWVKRRDDSFPPIIINITDGESTDADPSPSARDLTGLSTSQGNALLFTAYLGAGGGKQILYPDQPPTGLSSWATTMFNVSSVVPEVLRSNAESMNVKISPRGRGFLFNASLDEVSGLVNFGTSVTPRADQ